MRSKLLLWAAAAIGVVGMALGAGSLAQRNLATAADGSSAPAEVLRADDGSCLFGSERSHCFALRLRVHPPGASAFERTLDVNVKDPWAARVQPGQWVSVILLRDRPGEIGLDQEAFAGPAPQPPASAQGR